MNRRGRIIGAGPRIRFQQFGKARFVKIALRTFAIGLDPFGMLGAKVVVNLNSQGRESAARSRPGGLRARRFRSDEHDELDNADVKLFTLMR